MRDFKTTTGHFAIDVIDNNDNVIDSYEDDNMIMVSASTSMAEIFSNSAGSVSVDSFRLGTMGHSELGGLLQPKISGDGFINTRNRMFSEYMIVSSGSTIPFVNQNDVIFYSSPANAATHNKYYRYLGNATLTNYVAATSSISDTTVWVVVPSEPYNHIINFTTPAPTTTVVTTEFDNGASVTASSDVTTTVSGSSVTFVFNIPVPVANGQDLVLGNSSFTEAALYANGRIFSHKTFIVKSKDFATSLKITWTITF